LLCQQQDPNGYQVQFNSFVAKRVAELTQQLVQAEGGEQQDPLVMLKQRELDLKALDIQRRANESQQDMERKTYEFEDRLDVEKMKLRKSRATSSRKNQSC
jgi:hypothetical protein